MNIAAAESSILVTPAQRSQFKEAGYFITDMVFDAATIASVREAFEQLWQQDIDAAIQRGADQATLDFIRARPFMPQLDHRHPACHAFVRHRVFLDLARQLVGPDVDLTWNQAILKAPGKGASVDTAFGWHQDQWYAQKGDYARDSNLDILTDPDNSITCWVAISRTTVDNGTLWVLPGRHREGLLPHEWNADTRDWQGQYDTSWRVPAVLRPGQMLVFNKFLPHASGPNLTQEMRMAYQLGYTVPGLKRGPSRDVSPMLRSGAAVS